MGDTVEASVDRQTQAVACMVASIAPELLERLTSGRAALGTLVGPVPEEVLDERHVTLPPTVLIKYVQGALTMEENYEEVEAALRINGVMEMYVREMLEEEEEDIRTGRRAYRFIQQLDSERGVLRDSVENRMLPAEPEERDPPIPVDGEWVPASDPLFVLRPDDYERLVQRGQRDPNDPLWEH